MTLFSCAGTHNVWLLVSANRVVMRGSLAQPLLSQEGDRTMLPSSFEYHRADTLDEALSLLATYGDDAKVLAGGQSLIPMMKLRFAYPGHLIDVNRIAGL
ncbi:MAG: FAD binding domain-containing protein, partial [Planctomycetaceae bacterium]